MNDVHYSSKSNEWATPEDLFSELNGEFGFTLDAAATHENAKCERYFTVDDDGLSRDWSGEVVFLNPPYGRAIGRWVKKAHDESAKGAVVVCLIPARTDTRYWHDYVFGCAEIRFIKGRIKFVGGDGSSNSAPFPSAVVVFTPDSHRCEEKRERLQVRDGAVSYVRIHPGAVE